MIYSISRGSFPPVSDPMSTSSRVFLIDGSSQMYRAYHAMRGGGLTGPAGKSTHAVYIFVTMLRKLIADHAPQFIAASFDLAGPTFRSELATDYKANRSPMPPDLAEQIPWVHEACEALGVPILTSQRFEADDVIGALAEKAVEAGFNVAIVTGDKFLPTGARRDCGLQPEEDGMVRRGGREEVWRHAGAGRGRTRADGRLDRQHQGRSRQSARRARAIDYDLRVDRCAAGACRKSATSATGKAC